MKYSAISESSWEGINGLFVIESNYHFWQSTYDNLIRLKPPHLLPLIYSRLGFYLVYSGYLYLLVRVPSLALHIIHDLL